MRARVIRSDTECSAQDFPCFGQVTEAGQCGPEIARRLGMGGLEIESFSIQPHGRRKIALHMKQ